MVSGFLLVIAYIIYALGESAPASDDLKSWALSMLIFIGIGIGLTILFQILFHIALSIGISVEEGENDDKKVEKTMKFTMFEDERDKLIGLKSARVGYACAGAGFILALAVLALGKPALAALHIAFASFAAGSLVEGILGVYVYFHERGVKNG